MKVRIRQMKRVIAFRQSSRTTVYVRGYLSAKNHVATMRPSVSRDGQLELFFFGYVNCFRTDFYRTGVRKYHFVCDAL